MQFGGVAFVSVKIVLREFFVIKKHFSVARCFGDNGGRGNYGNFIIALYDCFWLDPIAILADFIRRREQQIKAQKESLQNLWGKGKFEKEHPYPFGINSRHPLQKRFPKNVMMIDGLFPEFAYHFRGEDKTTSPILISRLFPSGSQPQIRGSPSPLYS